MREIRTSGLMSGDGRRSDLSVVTAPVLDSTSLMRMIMSERDARGPEDDDKSWFHPERRGRSRGADDQIIWKSFAARARLGVN